MAMMRRQQLATMAVPWATPMPTMLVTRNKHAAYHRKLAGDARNETMLAVSGYDNQRNSMPTDDNNLLPSIL